ncbi:MAG: alginate export family protein [Stagnimonas sp.]|nr:alginate export family protein [Stagnimonas sp.]
MARLSAATALLALASSAAAAGEFGLTRWSEDHRDLADAARSDSPLDAIKHIPLGEGAGHYLSFGGQWRLKPVSFDAPLFGLGAAGADGYVYQRLNLHADWQAGPRFRAYLEIGDARVWGKKAAPAVIDANHTDLQLGFVDFRAPVSQAQLRLRLGRQELMFDSAQRFVALREGPNVRRAFDGALLDGALGDWTLSAFHLAAVEYRNTDPFDDRSDSGIDFSGLRLRRAFPSAQVDGYWYRYSRDQAAFGGQRARERRDTVGAQSTGRAGAFDWDLEAAWQTGDFGAAPVRAWAFGSVLGYSLEEMPWRSRLGLQFDAASGDRRAGDGRLDTFNPLFPKAAYFSQAGLTDFANLVHAGAFLILRPSAGSSFGIAAGHMARQSRADAAYAQPLLPIPRSTGDDKDIGDYLRLNASYRVNRHLTLSGEFLRYRPAPSLRRVGADTADYAELVARFLF